MKKLTALLLCCLLLTGCGATDTPTEPSADPTQSATETELPAESTEESTETEHISFKVYTPNENLDGFHETQVQDVSVLKALQDAGVLSADVEVISAALEGTALTVDMNAAFRDQLLTQGSTGERMLMGSVVNTFLSAYGAETVTVTVEGEILESGHVIYDFPMEYFE